MSGSGKLGSVFTYDYMEAIGTEIWYHTVKMFPDSSLPDEIYAYCILYTITGKLHFFSKEQDICPFPHVKTEPKLVLTLDWRG